jgi:hypothetical protein
VFARLAGAKVQNMDIQDVRRTNLAAWVVQHGGHATAARAVGLKQSTAAYLSACINGYAIGERSARNWERRLRLQQGALDKPPALAEQPPPYIDATERGMAQNLSHLAQTVAPTLTWEQLMAKPNELPAEFHVVLPDDAMAPRAPAGVKVKFKRDQQPAPGDAVLVQLGNGALYFREYRARVGGAWEAHATNPAYPSLASDHHQLVVLAVFSGIDTPWSALAR